MGYFEGWGGKIKCYDTLSDHIQRLDLIPKYVKRSEQKNFPATRTCSTFLDFGYIKICPWRTQRVSKGG